MCVGYVNALYMRAEYFTLDQIGLFTLITSNAMIVSPFASLGMGSSFLKFFSSFDHKDRNRFFSFLFLITIAGILFTAGIGFILRNILIERYQETAPEYINYLSITGIVIISNSLFELFMNYSRTILRVVFPVFIRELFLKVGSFSLVLGYALNWWDFDGAIYGLGISFGLAFIFLFLQLTIVHKFQFHFDFKIISKKIKGEVAKFASYSMLLAGSFAFINNISYDQLTVILGSEASGIFNTCFFIAIIIELPRRNMANIISPILSEEMEKNNLKEVENLYKKSSITMSIIGALLFIGITTNLDDLFSYIPKGESFRIGFWAVVGVGIAKMLVMVSSFAGEIINFSTRYIFNLYSQLIAAVVLLTLNAFLIPLYGISGVALSYLTAVSVQLCFRGLFIWKKFKIHPFTNTHLKLLFFSILLWIGVYFFDLQIHPVLNILIRSTVTTIVFTVVIYKMKISKDINMLINSILIKMSSYIKK